MEPISDGAPSLETSVAPELPQGYTEIRQVLSPNTLHAYQTAAREKGLQVSFKVLQEAGQEVTLPGDDSNPEGKKFIVPNDSSFTLISGVFGNVNEFTDYMQEVDIIAKELGQ